jgi:hypothetical protein
MSWLLITHLLTPYPTIRIRHAVGIRIAQHSAGYMTLHLLPIIVHELGTVIVGRTVVIKRTTSEARNTTITPQTKFTEGNIAWSIYIGITT